MAGFTQTEQQATLNARFPSTGGTDYVGYSTNGSTQFAGIARTAVGATNWAAATAATPSVKANTGVVTSAASTIAGTVAYFAIFTASTGGTQRLDWTPLAIARTVAVGDWLTFAAGQLAITLD